MSKSKWERLSTWVWFRYHLCHFNEYYPSSLNLVCHYISKGAKSMTTLPVSWDGGSVLRGNSWWERQQIIKRKENKSFQRMICIWMQSSQTMGGTLKEGLLEWQFSEGTSAESMWRWAQISDFHTELSGHLVSSPTLEDTYVFGSRCM